MLTRLQAQTRHLYRILAAYNLPVQSHLHRIYTALNIRNRSSYSKSGIRRLLQHRSVARRNTGDHWRRLIRLILLNGVTGNLLRQVANFVRNLDPYLVRTAIRQRTGNRDNQFSRHQTELVTVNRCRSRVVYRHRNIIQRHLDRIRIQTADIGSHDGRILQYRPHRGQLRNFGPVSRLNRINYRRLRIHDHFPRHKRCRTPGKGINGDDRHVVVSFRQGHFTGESAAGSIHIGPARQLAVGIDFYRSSTCHVGQVHRPADRQGGRINVFRTLQNKIDINFFHQAVNYLI